MLKAPISSLQDFQSQKVHLLSLFVENMSMQFMMLARWSQARESFVLLMVPYWNVYCFRGIPAKDG